MPALSFDGTRAYPGSARGGNRGVNEREAFTPLHRRRVRRSRFPLLALKESDLVGARRNPPRVLESGGGRPRNGMRRRVRRHPITGAEEREVVNAIFAAALVILAIFLGFVGVLAAVEPQVEGISFLHGRFSVAVWAGLFGVILSAGLGSAALLYLSGYPIKAGRIIFGVHLLIATVIVATVSLAWAIAL